MGRRHVEHRLRRTRPCTYRSHCPQPERLRRRHTCWLVSSLTAGQNYTRTLAAHTQNWRPLITARGLLSRRMEAARQSPARRRRLPSGRLALYGRAVRCVLCGRQPSRGTWCCGGGGGGGLLRLSPGQHPSLPPTPLSTNWCDIVVSVSSSLHSKHYASNQCCFKVGPPSAMLAQHPNSIFPMHSTSPPTPLCLIQSLTSWPAKRSKQNIVSN